MGIRDALDQILRMRGMEEVGEPIILDLPCEENQIPESEPPEFDSSITSHIPNMEPEIPRAFSDQPGFEEPPGVPAPPTCPPLPAGVHLVSYQPKLPPVAVQPCIVVTDVELFIIHHLAELDARLNHPLQIRAGGGVYEILFKLQEVGLDLMLEPQNPLARSADTKIESRKEPNQRTDWNGEA